MIACNALPTRSREQKWLNNLKSKREKKKPKVWKLCALKSVNYGSKHTKNYLVPRLVLEEQGQVTKYETNTLILLLFSTVSGDAIRRNFDFFCSPTLQIVARGPNGDGGRGKWLYCFPPTFLDPLRLPVWRHKSLGSLVQISKGYHSY